MAPQANQPFSQLDTLTPALLAAGGSTADLVGVDVFGSSSVMDDMALAAVWLAEATGKPAVGSAQQFGRYVLMPCMVHLVFGSSSVMDDMALAAVWLAKATGRCFES